MPQLAITLPEKNLVDVDKLFKTKPEALFLEVGFGGGEHLVALAEKNPKMGFIGCEPFLNGVASLLAYMEDKKITNIRIFPDDACTLLDVLPNTCLKGCFVLYPDPWPKKRHIKRRFINPANLDRLARTLKTGAELFLATDVTTLAEWMRDQINEHTDFEFIYYGTKPPDGWLETRYEKKGIAARRVPYYMIAKRS